MKPITLRRSFAFFIIAALMAMPLSLRAGARKIHVQGKLTDSGGAPLSGAQTVTFKLYDAATGGTMVWTSGVLSVTPTGGGLFNVPLQDGTPSLDSVSFDKTFYLGITVGADPEMAPRQELGASSMAHGSPGDFSVGGNLTVSIPRSDQGLLITDKGSNFNPVFSLSRNGSTKLKLSAQSNEGHITGTGTGGLFLGGSDGAEHLVIAQNGNVGAGTTSPQAKLHAVATALEVLRLERTGTTPAQYRFHVQPVMNGDNSDLQIIADTNATGYGFYARNAQGIATHGLGIDRHGSVGVGTESPQYKLDVAGIIRGNNVTPSDRNLKMNLRPLSADTLDKVTQLNGKTFEWNKRKIREVHQSSSRRRGDTKAATSEADPGVGYPDGEQIGLVAQEVEALFPQLVLTDADGVKSVSYMGVTAVLLEAVKEQAKRIDALRRDVEALKKKAK